MTSLFFLAAFTTVGVASVICWLLLDWFVFKPKD